MAEYIEREALLKSLDMAMECKDCPRNVNRKTYYDRCACSEVGDICNIITDFPTATDVQPVKRGKWVEESMMYVCSNCKHEFLNDILSIAIWETGEPYFCPWCGADMRTE